MGLLKQNCKTVYTSSILVVASINIINALQRLFVRPEEGAEFAQQAAYQPSGNGMSGQARWLSLWAFGASSNIGGWAKKSSCGAGSIAILTASSNRSYSTSLIALSGFPRAQGLKSGLVSN
jgi:hypothetical protein